MHVLQVGSWYWAPSPWQQLPGGRNRGAGRPHLPETEAVASFLAPGPWHGLGHSTAPSQKPFLTTQPVALLPVTQQPARPTGLTQAGAQRGEEEVAVGATAAPGLWALTLPPLTPPSAPWATQTHTISGVPALVSGTRLPHLQSSGHSSTPASQVPGVATAVLWSVHPCPWSWASDTPNPAGPARMPGRDVQPGRQEPFPAQHASFPSALTPILLFLVQEKAYFPHEVTSHGSSDGEVGAPVRAGPVPLLWSPLPAQLSFFLLCWSLGLTHPPLAFSESQSAFKARTMPPPGSLL